MGAVEDRKKWLTVLNIRSKLICVVKIAIKIFVFSFHRGNNVSDMKEVAKLKCLPLLRALLLMGECTN